MRILSKNHTANTHRCQIRHEQSFKHTNCQHFTSNTDHIDSCISGVLTEKLSDHQSIHTYHEQVSYFEEIPKYVETEKRDAFFIDQFITELKKIYI